MIVQSSGSRTTAVRLSVVNPVPRSVSSFTRKARKMTSPRAKRISRNAATAPGASIAARKTSGEVVGIAGSVESGMDLLVQPETRP